MQTYLKTRPVGAQFFIFLFLVLSGLFIFVVMIGTAAALKLTGLSLAEISDVDNWNYADPRYLHFVRIMLAIQFVGVYIIPVFVFAYLSDRAPARYLGLRRSPAVFFAIGVLLMLAALPLVQYIGELNQEIHFPDAIEGWMRRTEDQARQQTLLLLQNQSATDLLINIVMVAGFAGVGEELFFRGVLQRLAIWGFKNVWAGIIVTAVLFSAFHFQFYGFFPRLLLGIILGAIYWYSGSLWPAMVAHFFYDALLITLAYFHPEMLTEEQTSVVPRSTLMVLAVVSAVVTAGLVFYMRKKSGASNERFQAERSLAEPQSFTFEP